MPWSAMPKARLRATNALPGRVFWTGRDVVYLLQLSRMVALPYERLSAIWGDVLPSSLTWRDAYSAVWTGQEVIVWGGADHSGYLRDGAAFDALSRRWRLLPASPLDPRAGQVAVWTGREMIVITGGNDRGYFVDGAAYDPSADSWRAIASMPVAGRATATATWTDREILVWGGSGISGCLADGAAYDPLSDRWRLLSPGPLEPREKHSAVWTGRELVVWGGTPRREASGHFSDGAAYDPDSDSWRVLSPAPLRGRYGHTAVWTGTQVLIWGGSDELIGPPVPARLSDGAAYIPGSDQWYQLPDSPLGSRYEQLVTWTGEEMILWGGCCEDEHAAENFTDGAIYRPDQ